MSTNWKNAISTEWILNGINKQVGDLSAKDYIVSSSISASLTAIASDVSTRLDCDVGGAIGPMQIEGSRQYRTLINTTSELSNVKKLSNYFASGALPNTAKTFGEVGTFLQTYGRTPAEEINVVNSDNGLKDCQFEYGKGSTTVGDLTMAKGEHSHAEGKYTIAGANASHVEGLKNIICQGGGYCHVEGGINVLSSGYITHVEGQNNTVVGSQATHVGGTSNLVKDCGTCFVVGRSNSVVGCQNTVVFGTGTYIASEVSCDKSFIWNTADETVSMPSTFTYMSKTYPLYVLNEHHWCEISAGPAFVLFQCKFTKNTDKDGNYIDSTTSSGNYLVDNYKVDSDDRTITLFEIQDGVSLSVKFDGKKCQTIGELPWFNEKENKFIIPENGWELLSGVNGMTNPELLSPFVLSGKQNLNSSFILNPAGTTYREKLENIYIGQPISVNTLYNLAKNTVYAELSTACPTLVEINKLSSMENVSLDQVISGLFEISKAICGNPVEK